MSAPMMTLAGGSGAGSTNLNIRRVAHLPYLAAYYMDKALAAHY